MPSDSRQATVSWRPLLFGLVSEYVECREAAKFTEMTAPSGVPRMKTMLTAFKAITIAVTSLLLFAGAALAAEIHVMNSGGFSAAYRALAPEFEAATKNVLVTAWGPSMGTTPEAIPNRLARGEPADVLIMVGEALDELIKRGKAVAGSRVDLAGSKIGMVVRAGAPKPDISTVEAFKRALVNAKSIAYSDSASGVYLSTVLFQRLGIADQIAGKSKMIPAEPVGAVVARGDAELGFQQISELLPVPGIELVGPLPPEIQKVTVFAAGIAVGAKQPEAGGQLIKFMSSPAAAPAIIKSGLEPMTSR
jgi:molybdate transport system substrate-binding protein